MAPKSKEDVFANEAISDIWMNTTDIVGDATVAKELILKLAAEFYNLPWDTWKSLQEAALFNET